MRSGPPDGDDPDDRVGPGHDPDRFPPGPFPFSGRRRRLPEEGEIEVFVGDEQSAVAVDTGRWQALARAVLWDEGIRGDAELSVLFVDEATIAQYNERFREVPGPTDVLAFPLEDELVEPGRFPDSGTTGPVDPRARTDAPELPLLLGDVVICPAVAARNAFGHAGPTHDGSVEAELALLVVHGTLHVLGFDHDGAEPAAAMAAREQAHLERHHRGGTPP